jgi:hypothetical protein
MIPRHLKPERKAYIKHYYTTVWKPKLQKQQQERVLKAEKELSSFVSQASVNKELEETEALAFLAAVFLGEGSIGMTHQRKRGSNGAFLRPVLYAITNTDETLVRYCKYLIDKFIGDIFPFKSNYYSRHGRKDGYQKSFYLRTSKLSSIFRFLLKIRPFLPANVNLTKRADLLLEYCVSRLKWGKKPNGLYCYYSDREIEIYQQIWQLTKKRGKSKTWIRPEIRKSTMTLI